MLLLKRSVYDLILQVIAAEGEHKASRALRHAADIITGNPAALQVLIMIKYCFVVNLSPHSFATCRH